MTTLKWACTSFGIAVLLASLSWLTLSPLRHAGTPQVLAPLNLLLLIPAMYITIFTDTLVGNHSTGMLRGIGAVAAVMPIAFFLWCRPVLAGNPNVPMRSLVLLCLALPLSALLVVGGYSHAVHYQGGDYAAFVTLLSVVFWFTLGAMAVTARLDPSFGHNLIFHVALFAVVRLSVHGRIPIEERYREDRTPRQSGIRACDPDLLALGLPGVESHSQVVASLPNPRSRTYAAIRLSGCK